MTLYPLRDYQAEDLAHLGTKPEVQILNPMGMGKTREAVERDRLIRAGATGQTLVVCPDSARRGWLAHFTDYQPGLRVAVFDNTIRDAFMRAFGNAAIDVLIVPWQTLRLPPRNPQSRQSWAQSTFYPIVTDKRLNFLHVIADEAHRIKTMKAQQTRVLKKIQTAYKTAITGTPMANYPWDWWSMLNWLKPKEFRSFWAFYEKYVNYYTQFAGAQQFKVPLGPKNAAELWGSVQDFTAVQPIERLGLREPVYQQIKVDLTPTQRRIYSEMNEDMVAWLGELRDQPLSASVVISRLQRLQQFAIGNAHVEYSEHRHKASCNEHCQKVVDETVILQDPSSKIDAVMELIEDNFDEQFVVYSQFRRACELLAARLAARRIEAGLYYGGVAQRERDEIVERFSLGKLRVFAATIGAGGEAIDGLQNHCNRIVFIDRAWTPSANDQAEGRVYRQGQSRPVQIIDIVAVNTIDKGRLERIDLKRQWIEQMLGAA